MNKTLASTTGLTLLDTNKVNKGESCFITSSFNSGIMPSGVKLAALADTDDTDLVEGGIDADRSVNANHFSVAGTIAKTVVVAGADVVGYSGFSTSNYLSRAYDADFDPGTSAFYILGWLKEVANSAIETILERDSATTAQRFTLALTAAGFLTFTCDDNTTARAATSTVSVDTAVWTQFVATYDGEGGVYLYLNGALNASTTGSALLTLSNAAAVLNVGLAVDGVEPLTNGSLALLRIGASSLSADQIRAIYEAERSLFNAGAQATFYGTSDAVTALAHDPRTGLLHVGTSQGRSSFRGLQRVSNTTTGITKVSAMNGLVVEG